MTERRVAVVVPAKDGGDDLRLCLERLRTEVGPADSVLVVDDGSTDGSIDAARRAHPGAEVVPTGGNLGFAGASNVGLRRALEGGARWALLLNQDAFLEPGALAALVAEGERRPGAAALQPLLVSAKDPTRVDSLGIRVQRGLRATDAGMGSRTGAAPRETTPIFGACAAAVLLRTSTLRECGLLDEGFHVLFEDVDLAFRIRAAGGEALLVPAARVAHRRGISAGSANAAGEARRRFFLHRNLAALGIRWWPLPWLLPAAPLLAWQMLAALRLRGAAPGHACLPLWRRALALRRESRRSLRARKVDGWFC